MGRAKRASGRDTIGDVASGPGRTPGARMMRSAARSRRNFSALQSLENSQNAERNLDPVRIPRRRRIVAALAERGGRRAPRFPSVNQAKLTRSATASTALAQPPGDREENLPPCNPLKNLKTGKESRSRTGTQSTPSSPRSWRSPSSPPAPLRAGPPISSQSPTITIRMSGRTRSGKPCTVAHFTSPVGVGKRVAARPQRSRKSSVG
jgi:hypothetical protein